MIKIDNYLFLFFIPIVVLLFILDKKRKVQYVHKVSILKVLQSRLLSSNTYLEKVIFYSLLLSLIIVLSQINLIFNNKGKVVLILNLPFVDDNILNGVRNYLGRVINDDKKLMVFVNSNLLGEYSLNKIDINLLKKQQYLERFSIRNIDLNEINDIKSVFIVKLCHKSDMTVGSVNTTDVGLSHRLSSTDSGLPKGNIYKICINDFDNTGIVEMSKNKVFVFNYSGNPKTVNVKINKKMFTLNISSKNISTLKIPQDIRVIKIMDKDDFVEDNLYVSSPLKIFVQKNLFYTAKALKSLGYKIYRTNTLDKFDLAIVDYTIDPISQTLQLHNPAINSKFVWVLLKHFDNNDKANENDIKSMNLRIENLNIPPNFDVNKIRFSTVFGYEIYPAQCKRTVPFIVDTSGTIYVGLCEKDCPEASGNIIEKQFVESFQKSCKKIIYSTFNWEETKLNDFAKNVDAPLPVFIDSILHYLFSDYYNRQENFIGKKLFIYFNSDFPNIQTSKLNYQSSQFPINNFFKYVTIFLFVIYIVLKIAGM